MLRNFKIHLQSEVIITAGTTGKEFYEEILHKGFMLDYPLVQVRAIGKAIPVMSKVLMIFKEKVKGYFQVKSKKYFFDISETEKCQIVRVTLKHLGLVEKQQEELAEMAKIEGSLTVDQKSIYYPRKNDFVLNDYSTVEEILNHLEGVKNLSRDREVNFLIMNFDQMDVFQQAMDLYLEKNE